MWHFPFRKGFSLISFCLCYGFNCMHGWMDGSMARGKKRLFRVGWLALLDFVSLRYLLGKMEEGRCTLYNYLVS
ncbi:uncharacterized protein B0T23DRAFT_376124 [Neurospora hispaniola]|uniref:Uncharacterized protein n=1 Tax=Neurospora hispaniola TaxID=588809 RepID=A0AAJ0I932_9PEZI|nr:hypothetical protein B0T23DRAFT_376124 [Neurospora hispaniola]